MKMPHITESPDPFWHSHNPLPDIQIVGALIQEHAAALPVPGGPPAAGIVIGLSPIPVIDNPDKPLDLPKRSLLNQGPKLPVERVGALIIHDPEHCPALSGRMIHPAHARRIHAGRFFREHVKLSFEGRRRNHRMKIVGRCNQHGINPASIKKRLILFILINLSSEAFPGPCETVPVTIAHRSKPDTLYPVLKNLHRMGAAHISNPDDSDPQNIHVCSLCQ